MPEGYVGYQPSQPEIRCTFLYPANWQVREIVEDGYVEVFIASPHSQAGNYAISFTVDVIDATDQTPTEAATAWLSRFRSAFSLQEWGPDATTVAGQPAVAVEVAYSMPVPPNSINPQWTVIRERSIFFRHESRLYELNYAAPEADYETWLEAGNTLVESLDFVERPAETGLYRAVDTVAAQHVREESPGYDQE